VYASQKIKIRQDGGTSGAAAPLVEIPVAAMPVLEDLVRARVCYIATPQLMPNA
jgi:hypothetical protein